MSFLIMKTLMNACILGFCFERSFAEPSLTATLCPCKIDSTKATSDCSGLNLDSVPICVPNNTRVLRLSRNSFRHVEDGVFERFDRLEELYLDLNSIWKLDTNAFIGLSKLLKLSLAWNGLRFADSYAEDVFEPLVTLRDLYLQHNCNSYSIYQNNCTYPENALSPLKTLHTLSIDGLQNRSLGHGFSSLSNLRELRMSDQGSNYSDHGFCVLPLVTNATFAALRLTSLSYFELNDCNMKSIEPNSFFGLQNLTTLFVTNMRRLCDNAMYNASVGLNTTNLRELRFTNWCAGAPHSIMLDEKVSMSLTRLPLQILDFSHQKILFIYPSFIEFIPITLKEIILNDNLLQGTQFVDKLTRLINLEYFDISFQFFIRNDLGKNVKSVSDSTGFKYSGSGSDFILLPQNLLTVKASHIEFDLSVPPASFRENNVTYIDASNCMFLSFIGPIIGLNKLNFLNISFNKLEWMHSDSLADMPHLEKLLMKNNQMGKHITKSKTLFRNLASLKLLDMSENQITELPRDIFISLSSLEELLLGGNMITKVDFNLNSLVQLKLLDLSRNFILLISSANLNFFNSLETLRVNLMGNTLPCNCEQKDTVTWLLDTTVHVANKSELKCTYENKTVVSLTRLDDILSQLPYDCSTWIVSMSCVAAFCGLLLTASLVTIFYHKRWQLRYLYYIGKKSLNPYHPLDEVAEPDIDCYISYDKDHQLSSGTSLQEFVTEEVIKHLKDKGFDVRQENVTPGKSVGFEISNVLKNCKKTIVFMSEEYCRNYWNVFEFNMSVFEGMYSKRNVIVLVFVEDVADTLLTQEIASFVRARRQDGDFLWLHMSRKDMFLNSLTTALRK